MTRDTALARLRGRRPRSRGHRPRAVPRRLRQRGARVLRAARLLRRRRGRASCVAEGATALGGRIPFNTDGGLIARGHPAGPTGLAMVHEIVQQLRGEAGRAPGRRGAHRARPPGGRRQRVHRVPVRSRLNGVRSWLTTSCSRRAARSRRQLWPHMKTSSGQFPAAKLAPDFYRYVAETAFGMIWSRPGLAAARPQPRHGRPARRPRQDRGAARPPGRRAQQRLHQGGARRGPHADGGVRRRPGRQRGAGGRGRRVRRGVTPPGVPYPRVVGART